MPKVEIDYTQTTIYKICCNDTSITDIYVGSTTNFANRKYGHKTSCNTSTTPNHNLNVYKFIRTNGGWNNWSMLQIENIKCKDKREALIREKYWIEILKPKLNINNPYTSVEEKVVQKNDWYENNKDSILEKAKNNYEENKEQKIKYQTQYAQENKEKISEYHKEYRKLNKETLAEKTKIYREEHKEEARISQKEWREKNKEILNAKQGEIVNCECGHQYTFGNRSRHFQSKVHLQFTENISDYQKELMEQQKKEQKEKNKEAERVKQGEIINCECGRQYTFGNRSRHFQTKVHLQYKEQSLESI